MSGFQSTRPDRPVELITPERAREEYVNLMRWRLQHELEYKTTFLLQIENTRGVPIYHMIFATDHSVGGDIMTYLYGTAAKKLPALKQEAIDESHGLQHFDPSKYDAARRYEYEEPWDPGEGLPH